ncbi:hypothetical protein [Planctomycetes bacterium Poly30]|uniref:hypothetical protein n=1 Tax=Saltatorellus ferox TaxID=2528018 RepID=UPI00119D833C
MGAPVEWVSTAAERAPLLGSHGCNDGLFATILNLDERGDPPQATFLLLRMDSYCGQFEENMSGTWDLIDGEVQLYPALQVDPIRHEALTTFRILLVDGKLELIESSGAIRAMNWKR